MDKARFKYYTYFCYLSFSNFSTISTDFIQLCKPDNFVGLSWLCAKKRKPHIPVEYSGLYEFLNSRKDFAVFYRYLLFCCAEPKLKKELE